MNKSELISAIARVSKPVTINDGDNSQADNVVVDVIFFAPNPGDDNTQADNAIADVFFATGRELVEVRVKFPNQRGSVKALLPKTILEYGIGAAKVKSLLEKKEK